MMMVAALLSAALACFRNFVLHAVVLTVKRIYNPIVAIATPAYCQPNLYPYLSSPSRDIQECPKPCRSQALSAQYGTQSKLTYYLCLLFLGQLHEITRLSVETSGILDP
jgi:hypothetical protein